MKSKAVGFKPFFAVLLICAPGAGVNAGVIHFQGQIVDGSCEARPVNSRQILQNTQRVNISGAVALAVSTVHNACSGGAIPFEATYRELAISRPAVVEKAARYGVVTLTYQ